MSLDYKRNYPVIASFNFDTGVNVEAMNKQFTGGSATYDQD